MNYHINTGLVIEEFQKGDGCPLCRIEKIVETGICKELLADGCMDDAVRTQVNAKGFCPEHFEQLYLMPSKLSLALQLSTRLNTMLKVYKKPSNSFSAKKLSDNIVKSSQTCIVCDYTKTEMEKYYRAIPILFLNERDFRQILKDNKNVCQGHFAMLLKYSAKAGKMQKEYLSVIYDNMKNKFDYDLKLLDAFAKRHDYRNLGKSLGEAENAIMYFHDDLYGKK